jgi:hypothetical protein
VDNYGNPESPGPDVLVRPPAPDQPEPVPPLVTSPAMPAAGPGHVTGLEPHSGARGYGIQMRRRSPAGVWLLNLATLGVYGLVYWYKIHAELLEYDRRRHISPVFELMSVFLLAWTVILPLMSIGSLAQKIRIAQSTAGLHQECSGTRGILLALLFGTHVIYYQRRLNEIIAAGGAARGERIQLRV